VERCVHFLVVVVTLVGPTLAPSGAQEPQLPPPPIISPAPGDGIPNLNGIWNREPIRTEEEIRQQLGGKLPPFTAHGLERWENVDPATNPTGMCQPGGTGRAFHSPFPFQIVQTEGLVTFLFELYHDYHRVYVDGRTRPEWLETRWWGYSVGRYEGNKLIFETTGLDPRSWLFSAGMEHSEQLKLTQIFEKTGPDTIQVTETFEDPVFFTEPWSISYELRREPSDLLEHICMDNPRAIVEGLYQSRSSQSKD
jgi:hypothetical protein